MIEKKWVIKSEKNPNSLEEIEEILLENRYIEDTELFFSQDASKIISPFELYGIKKSVQKLLKHIKNKSKIFIHGDYDADGIIATAILFDYLYRELKASVYPIIPDRVTEGYSLSESTLSRILEEGGNLVISVDCGVRDKELIEKYTKLGLDFIITDHHEFEKNAKGEEIIPTQYLVHPAHPKGKYTNPKLSGGAVAWKFVWAIDKTIGNSKEHISSKVLDYIDLASISLVTDIMPLVDENRLILKIGLEKSKSTNNIGLKCLMESAGIKELDSYSIGYGLGPRINSSGRIGDPLDSVRLFTTKDENKAIEISNNLNNLNLQRRELTDNSILLVDDETTLENKIIILKFDDLHEGVIGLVAGKYSQKYSKPTIVFTRGENNTLKASARSIKEVNITQVLSLFSNYLVRYGGHSQAAGLTMHEDNFIDFKTSIIKYFEEEITIPEFSLNMVDCELSSNMINEDLANLVTKFEPFGEANPRPRFILRSSQVIDVYSIGRDKTHVKLNILNNNMHFSCIGFNLKEKFEMMDGDEINIVFTPTMNNWNNKSELQLEIIDFV